MNEAVGCSAVSGSAVNSESVVNSVKMKSAQPIRFRWPGAGGRGRVVFFYLRCRRVPPLEAEVAERAGGLRGAA